MQVQEEMIRRANLHSGANQKKRVYSSKYALSGIVYCSKCGDIYRRVAWNNEAFHRLAVCDENGAWTRMLQGPNCSKPICRRRWVNAINLALGNKDSVIEKLQQNIESVINRADDTSVENIDIKLECLQGTAGMRQCKGL